MKARALAAFAAGLLLAVPASAHADVFNGRIAFSSFRVDPPSRTGDIFTMNNDGSDLRRLTTNPADDAQSDWAPDGRDIAYRIRKPNSRINFEVSRMTAAGGSITQLTDTPTGQASSQPTWYPDRSRLLFRRSGPGLISSVWTMGLLGEDADAPVRPAGRAVLSDDLTRHDQAPVHDDEVAGRRHRPRDRDERSRRDRPDHAVRRAGRLRLGTRVVAGRRADRIRVDRRRRRRQPRARRGDLGDGRRRRQPDPAHAQHRARRGAAWSPDGTMLAYSSGAGQRPRRHQRDDGERRAPAHADRLRGPRRVARLAADPRAGHRPPLRRRRGRRPAGRAGGGTGAPVLEGAPARAEMVARRAARAGGPLRRRDRGLRRGRSRRPHPAAPSRAPRQARGVPYQPAA